MKLNIRKTYLYVFIVLKIVFFVVFLPLKIKLCPLESTHVIIFIINCKNNIVFNAAVYLII